MYLCINLSEHVHLKPSSSSTSVTASENTTESNRSGSVTFVQENSGKSVEITLSQAKATVTYGYEIYFNGPTFYQWGYDEYGSSYKRENPIISRKIKYINGKYSSSENIPFTVNKTGRYIDNFIFSYTQTSFSCYPLNMNYDTETYDLTVKATQNESNKYASIDYYQKPL